MATTRNDDDPEALIATLASWASTQVGPVEVVADRSRRHRRAVVLEVEGPRERRWFVKWPKSQHCFRREARAYRRFVPILAGSAPRLVAADETRRALLLTVLPGRLAEHEDLQARRDVHRQAGVWLADLHGLSTPISDPGLGRKLGERLQRVCVREGPPRRLGPRVRDPRRHPTFRPAAARPWRRISAGWPIASGPRGRISAMPSSRGTDELLMTTSVPSSSAVPPWQHSPISRARARWVGKRW